ncbi:protein-disulfide reductase DsbD [Propionivibrio limicola]|uniref:protein-disulfide reductase DsbD n=1 Tax=Propionivibrio limicola TaxID=167645 RepID=UPI001290B268|nr:protein-disulfide reductase DsbD [Propionivibrio limicola]
MIVRLFRCFLLLILCVGAKAADPLPPALAFKPSARAVDGRTVEVHFEIADGYYLYRDKFRFAAVPPVVEFGAPVIPAGKEKLDETFGRVEVHHDSVTIRLPVERASSGTLPLLLNVTSQGCAEVGVCYPPQTQAFGIELPDPVAAAVSRPVSPPVTSAGNDESGRIARLLGEAEIWLVAASFFGFGLLLALTPCVFPMFPILSGIIAGARRHDEALSHGRGFALASAYVLGMAVTYTLAGVAAGFSGQLLSSALQNAWVLGGMALVFVALALSMFGFYELQLPAFVQSRVSGEAAHFKGGSLPGVAAMGALSALIVGPCVAAPLAGALLYIGQTGDALLGGLALFCLALGMGSPLLLIGLSAGTLLPKAGAWMEAVRKAFGVVLLAMAVWVVSPLLPLAVQMSAWALLLILPAVYLHALDPLPPHAGGWHRFWKGIGVVMLCAGVATLVGVLSGAKDPLQPLAGLRASAPDRVSPALSFERVRSVAELDARLQQPGAPVMLDFYADWCVSCKEMERFTFADPRVRAKLAGWRLLQADVTASSEADKALLARFRLYGPPGLIFFDRAGREIEGGRVVGYQDADEFLKTLAAVAP